MNSFQKEMGNLIYSINIQKKNFCGVYLVGFKILAIIYRFMIIFMLLFIQPLLQHAAMERCITVVALPVPLPVKTTQMDPPFAPFSVLVDASVHQEWWKMGMNV